MRKKLLAEFLGTAGLLMIVVGSGIMAQDLSSGNAAMALLANSIATGAGLYALIQTFGSISGAHFNPGVSLVEYFWKRISGAELIGFIFMQITGAIAGVLVTHLMFGQSIFQLSTRNRGELRYYISEVIATVGLLLVIALSGRKNVEATPSAVALFITSAYWFTSSTSFANPAVTIARSLTDTFAGILWTGIPWFVIAQILGCCIAFSLTRIFESR